MQIPELPPDLLNYFGGKAKSLDIMNIPNDSPSCLNLRIIDLREWFSKCGLRTEPVSSRNAHLRSHPRLTESETLCVGAQRSVLMSSPGDSNCTWTEPKWLIGQQET